jgi:quercetin dioxygenase-like cupin family protein/predicted enzyme related to lactoylglutathione lyase
MDVKKIKTELEKQYPGKKIILNPSVKPGEILCLVDPADSHPAYSTLVAAIDETKPHYHQNSAEIYYVLKGKLELIVEGARYFLKESQYRVVPPGKIHFAKGKETWVLIYSEPGWQKDDHFEVKKKPNVFLPSLSHIYLAVKNWQEMYRFYQQTLDLTIARGDSESGYVEFETGETKIILYQQEKMPPVLHNYFKSDNKAVVIGLRVEDLNSAAKFFEEKKIKLFSLPVKYPALKIEAFYLNDPEGNLLEIYHELN